MVVRKVAKKVVQMAYWMAALKVASMEHKLVVQKAALLVV